MNTATKKNVAPAASKFSKDARLKMMEYGFGILERISSKAMDIALAADKAEFSFKGLVVAKAPKLGEMYIVLAEQVAQAEIKAETKATELGMAWLTLVTEKSFGLFSQITEKLDINTLVQKTADKDLVEGQTKLVQAQTEFQNSVNEKLSLEQKVEKSKMEVEHLRKEIEALRTRPVAAERTGRSGVV
jgi:myosin heavy subunit